MRTLPRPRIGETLASVACLVAVLALLVAVDGRVRERASLLFTQVASEGVGTFGDRALAFGAAVVDAVKQRSVEEAPLLLFTGAGVVLLLFMLRT